MSVLRAGMLRLYRRVAGLYTSDIKPDHHTDMEVLVAMNAAEPEIEARVLRLRYLPRLVLYAPEQLHHLIRAGAIREGPAAKKRGRENRECWFSMLVDGPGMVVLCTF